MRGGAQLCRQVQLLSSMRWPTECFFCFFWFRPFACTTRVPVTSTTCYRVLFLIFLIFPSMCSLISVLLFVELGCLPTHYVMFVFLRLFLSYFNVCLSPAFVVLSVVKKRHSALVAGHTISIFIFSYQLYCIILLCWLSRFFWPCRQCSHADV